MIWCWSSGELVSIETNLAAGIDLNQHSPVTVHGLWSDLNGQLPNSFFITRVACVPLSPWAVSGASMHAIRIIAFCPLELVTRMVSPSPTATKGAGLFTAGVTGFGWLRLGADVGASAMYMFPRDPPLLPPEIPPPPPPLVEGVPHGSGSRLSCCWCGSRCYPPRHHGLVLLSGLTPTQHWQQELASALGYVS